MNKDELIDYCKEASQTISELDYKNRMLEKENQELKKKYENTVEKLSEQLELLTSKLDEYDLIVDERNQLKKQLEERSKDYCNASNIKHNYAKKLVIIQTQQKEFINYLEDKIYSIETKGTGINYNCEYDSEEDYVMAMQEQSRLNTLKEILQKYKEIIGGKDE